VTTPKGVQGYPLAWPDGWPRSKTQKNSPFKTPTDKARKKLLAEVALMGGTNVVLSTNVPLRTDGQMRADREPVDAGVAIYFQRDGKGMVFACDTYDSVRENIHALGLTIEALRGIERWGATEMMERAFSGFKQLAAENEGPSWWDTLCVEPHASVDDIERAFKVAARSAHPDSPGGSHDRMAALNLAREQGLNIARQRR
jgi:hypothetical protein